MMLQTIAFALAATLAASAAAQPTARPDPADPKATAPAPRYDSAFAGYRPHAEPPLAPWREVNDEVRDLGGHVGHLPRDTASRKPAPKPAAQPGHGGHK